MYCFISTVPSPSVTLSDNVVVLGSPATLQCTVMLYNSLTCSDPIAVTVNLVKIDSNSVVTTQQAEGHGSICNATLAVSTNALNSDGGQYICRVQLSYYANNSAFITLPAQIVSSTATLYVVGEYITYSVCMQSKYCLLFRLHSNSHSKHSPGYLSLQLLHTHLHCYNKPYSHPQYLLPVGRKLCLLSKLSYYHCI